jgi:hypothetical protein
MCYQRPRYDVMNISFSVIGTRLTLAAVVCGITFHVRHTERRRADAYRMRAPQRPSPIGDFFRT